MVLVGKPVRVMMKRMLQGSAKVSKNKIKKEKQTAKVRIFFHPTDVWSQILEISESLYYIGVVFCDRSWIWYVNRFG